MCHKLNVKENSNLNINWITKVIMSCDLFFFNELGCEVIVRFVDNDRIVDYHCLNFLFIITEHVGYPVESCLK